MIRSLVVSLCLFFFLTFAAVAVHGQQTFKTTSKSVIGYLEYLPDGYNSSNKDYPIVIFLHGTGEKGPNSTDPRKLAQGRALLEKLGPPKYVKQGTKFPFILISPQLKSNYGGWPTGYVMEVIEHVQRYLRVDKNRIYITGLSMGGYGTWAMIQQYPTLFAAAAPICGGGNLGRAKAIADEDLPVWAFHGDADNVVHVSNSINMVNAINRHNPNPRAKLSIYRGVKHDAWVRAYNPGHSYHNPNVYEWLMSHRRNSTPPRETNQAPVANAGPDKTIKETENRVVITGSGKDSDGTVKSYQWSKTSGGTVEMRDSDKKDLILTGFREGSYVFKLTVTDDKGSSHSDEMKLTVEAVRKPPVVNAGDDKTIELPTNTLTITGQARSEDGKITSTQWTKISGKDVRMSGEQTLQLVLRDLSEGEYKFRLTAKTDKNISGSDEVVVVVKAASNKAPIAKAGNDVTAKASDKEVRLAGSGSDDDGSITKYEWTKVSGPSVDMQNQNSETLVISNFSEGVYVFRLTVTDNQGKKASDDVKVTITAPVYRAPVAVAGPDKTVQLPNTTLTLKGDATSQDGRVTSFRWTKLSGSDVEMTGTESRELTLKKLREGEYRFRLTVKTDKGMSDSDDVTVTVIKANDNKPPIANAGSDRTIKSDVRTYVIKGSGKDEDGQIKSYRWSKRSGGDVRMENTESPELKISGFSHGVYVFELKVTDNDGASHSDDVRITVEKADEPKPSLPVVDAGKDQLVQLPKNSVKLNGKASVEHGKIVSYNWSQVEGDVVGMKDANTTALTVTQMTAGSYKFRLTAKTDKGISAFDEVNVVVREAANKAPVAEAGKDFSVEHGTQEFTLSGSATDEDGTIKTYRWERISGGSVNIADPASPKTKVTRFGEGVYVFRLTVTDNKGATDTDEVKVHVKGPGKPLAFAGNDQTIVLPENTITLRGGAKVDRGRITGYSWSLHSGGKARLTGLNTQTLVASDLREGIYVFRLTVTADNGLSGYDDIQVTVRAGNGGNTPPTVDAGQDHRIEEHVPYFVIAGNASDPDGEIVAFNWVKVSGGNVSLTNTDKPSLTISGYAPGTFVFRLTVTDNDGISASDEVKIIVNKPAQSPDSRPVAYAGNDRIIRLPVNAVTIRGGAKVEGRTIVSYEWEQVGGGRAKLSGMDGQTMVAEELEIGRYTFRLKATCDKGFSAYDDISITVKESLFSGPPAQRDAYADHGREGLIEESEHGFEDQLGSTDLTAGAVPTLENYEVAVYNDRGDKIFQGKWEADSFDEVFETPGFYVYHVLEGRRKVKVGKLMIQP